MDRVERWLPPLRAGRQPAGRALLAWLADPQAPRLCQLQGTPGTGKTHLLVWLATACSSPGAPDGQRADAALSLAGLNVDSATWSLAGLLGVVARTPAELVSALREDGRPRLLLLWDLNRAVEAAAITAGLLDPMLSLPGFRAVVEAPPVTSGAGRSAAVDEPAVLDLDDPRWTDANRFASWYHRLCGRSPFDAAQVFPSPGLALLAARVPASADPTAGVPAAWWSALPEELRPALLALAGVERPLTHEEWTDLADPKAVRHAEELLPADSPTGDTWWLPAGSLRELITAGSAEPDLHATVRALAATVPRTADGSPDLSRADQDRLGLLLRQAVRAGSAGQLLDDPTFLVHADPVAVTAALAVVPDMRFAPVWRAAGPALIRERNPGQRAEVLRTHLLGGAEDASLAKAEDIDWRTEWTRWLNSSDCRLVAAALGQGPYAGKVIMVDAEGVVQLSDLSTGHSFECESFAVSAHTRALTCLADGSVVALDSAFMPELLTGPALPVLPAERTTALADLPGAGDQAGVVHWLAPGQQLSQRLHEGMVTALDGVWLGPSDVADSPVPLLISGGADGCVRAWKPGFPPLAQPVYERQYRVTSVGTGETPVGLVIAAAWADGLLRVGCIDGSARADIRLGLAVHSVLVDSSGMIVAATSDGVVCLGLSPHQKYHQTEKKLATCEYSP